MKNRKGNIIYIPQDNRYAVIFYNNYDGYFIIDVDKVSLIKQYTWTCDKTRYEPVTTINGKKVRLSRFLSNTPSNLVCDHINGIVSDNRICNLRNCTLEQNNYNRAKFSPKVENVGSKYVIKYLPQSIASNTSFDTREEAENAMYDIINHTQGEFSYLKSQEMSKKNETYEFKKYIFCGGILEEISSLPEVNIFKRILRNILCNFDNGYISDAQFTKALKQLKIDYTDHKKLSA